MTENAKSRLPVWLLVSLIANALLIGLLIGGGMRMKHPPLSDRSERAGFSHALRENLSARDRAVVRQLFRQVITASRPEREHLREARQQLGLVLSQDPYDEAAVQAALEALRLADNAVRKKLHDEIVTRLPELTVDQRRALLHGLSASGPGGFFHLRNRREPPPPE